MASRQLALTQQSKPKSLEPHCPVRQEFKTSTSLSAPSRCRLAAVRSNVRHVVCMCRLCWSRKGPTRKRSNNRAILHGRPAPLSCSMVASERIRGGWRRYPGFLPGPGTVFTGCKFAEPLCAQPMNAASANLPPLHDLGGGSTACHYMTEHLCPERAQARGRSRRWAIVTTVLRDRTAQQDIR